MLRLKAGLKNVLIDHNLKIAIVNEKTYSCYSWSLNCGYVTTEAITKCPKCRGGVRSSTQIRTLGFVLILIGLFLAGLMGTIMYKFTPALLQAGELKGTGQHSGVNIPAWQLVGLFSTVLAFGVTNILAGLWQISTGRRNKWLFLLVLIVVILMALLVLPILNSI